MRIPEKLSASSATPVRPATTQTPANTMAGLRTPQSQKVTMDDLSAAIRPLRRPGPRHIQDSCPAARLELLQEFEAVAERIPRVKPAKARNLAVGFDPHRLAFEAQFQAVEVVGEHRGMPFRIGHLGFYAAMDLLWAAREPHAAATAQRFRFRHLGKPKQAMVERPRDVFTARRNRYLDMRKAKNRHRAILRPASAIVDSPRQSPRSWPSPKLAPVLVSAAVAAVSAWERPSRSAEGLLSPSALAPRESA